MTIELHLGDSVDVLAALTPQSFDAAVLDPPYELGMMGHGWDKAGIAFDVSFWRMLLALLEPGGHLVAHGFPRTHHRVWCAVEDAGFEIRDTLTWLRGRGYPKSKAHLKPLAEPILLARRPLEGTLEQNLEAYGNGVLGIDACRVGDGREHQSRDGESSASAERHARVTSLEPHAGPRGGASNGRWPPNAILSHTSECRRVGERKVPTGTAVRHNIGKSSRERVSVGTRGSKNADLKDDISFGESGLETVEAWDCAPGCPVAVVDAQSGLSGQKAGHTGNEAAGPGRVYKAPTRGLAGPPRDELGGSSRFFPTFQDDPDFRYIRGPSTAERDLGCEGFYWRRLKTGWERVDPSIWSTLSDDERGIGNIHPTCKPIELVRWLTRLVTPAGGRVLDCFMGSGTTGVACVQDGFSFVGIERDPDYYAVARARIAWTGVIPKEHGERLPRHPSAPQTSLFSGSR